MSQLFIRLIHCLSSKVFIHSPLINHLCNFHLQGFNSFISFIQVLLLISHSSFIICSSIFFSGFFIHQLSSIISRSLVHKFHSSNFHLCFTTHPSFIFIFIHLAFIPHSSIFHISFVHPNFHSLFSLILFFIHLPFIDFFTHFTFIYGAHMLTK